VSVAGRTGEVHRELLGKGGPQAIADELVGELLKGWSKLERGQRKAAAVLDLGKVALDRVQMLGLNEFRDQEVLERLASEGVARSRS